VGFGIKPKIAWLKFPNKTGIQNGSGNGNRRLCSPVGGVLCHHHARHNKRETLKVVPRRCSISTRDSASRLQPSDGQNVPIGLSKREYPDRSYERTRGAYVKIFGWEVSFQFVGFSLRWPECFLVPYPRATNWHMKEGHQEVFAVGYSFCQFPTPFSF